MTSPRSSLVNPSYAAGIEERLRDSIRVKEEVLKQMVPAIEKAARLLMEALDSGHKLLLCGNGGSAADSQHIAAELVGKLLVKRRALPAIALTTDTSALTALGNDFGYESVFRRQVEALGQPGDVLIGISTSGNSPNVLEAVKLACKMGLKTVGLTGRGGGALSSVVDQALTVPSDNTQRIQESHITIGHILCELIESHFAVGG